MAVAVVVDNSNHFIMNVFVSKHEAIL